jgi:hypothetical protein
MFSPAWSCRWRYAGCMFCPRLDELEHQVARACEIPRGSVVFSDCRYPIAKPNRTVIE